jgi:hypothetical protein
MTGIDPAIGKRLTFVRLIYQQGLGKPKPLPPSA